MQFGQCFAHGRFAEIRSTGCNYGRIIRSVKKIQHPISHLIQYMNGTTVHIQQNIFTVHDKFMNIHKTPPDKSKPPAAFHQGRLNVPVINLSPKLFLAALISHRTRSFAGRLARGLALAAAAGHSSFGQRSIIDCLNMFAHGIFPPRFIIYVILSRFEMAGKSLSNCRR